MRLTFDLYKHTHTEKYIHTQTQTHIHSKERRKLTYNNKTDSKKTLGFFKKMNFKIFL